ncbi:MAG TPA: hypothetical protein VF717_01300 [Pyrinomonadaceae bacterium]|jgi:hypothetical protein
MQTKSWKNRIGSAILGVSLLLGIGFASSVTTQAQYQNDRYERQRQYEREQRRRQREWEREQRRRQREAARYGNNGGYNNGGYNNGGYNNGGYGGYRNNDNYSNYGGSYEARQTALNAGYNEGRKAGMEDRSRGEGYNYADEGQFRSGDKDYNSRYGDREAYRQYFRQAFANGYADGYRGY